MRGTVAVIGGGISGLAAANRLLELDPSLEVILLESNARLGGVLQTTKRKGYLVEAAADSFLTSPPAAVDLCHRLGLGQELIGTDETRRRALVVCQGRLLEIPNGFFMLAPSRLWPLLSTPILSLRGKIRAGLEYFLPPRSDIEDESLESFVCRRFGRELFEKLAQPLVGGIYSADLRQLSIEATMPRFRKMEQEYGSLIRASLCKRRTEIPGAGAGARYGQFAALRGGMSTLVEAIEKRLPSTSVQLNSPAEGLSLASKGGWRLAIGGSNPRTLIVDGIIFAGPANHTAGLLASCDSEIAKELRRIEYTSCAVISFGLQREQIAHPLNAFGFVVPLVEQRGIFSCSFPSVKYSDRAPDNSVLLRVFVGGACQRGLLRFPHEQLIELAYREVADLLQIHGEPLFRHITRQCQAMPQYHVGHVSRVARIDARLRRFPSLALASSALRGVGVPACVQGGEDAASRVLAHLQKSQLHHVH